MSPHAPTVAELRADLAADLEKAPPGIGADMLRQFVAVLDDYMQQCAPQQPASPTIRERLNEAGRKRRAWKAFEHELPALFAEANATGRYGAESIAGIVGVSPSYVYRKLREQSGEVTGEAPPVGE
ncbi:hypothetical protein [Streptomyces sp. GQFP]|uniref:hypothetical protein n=1 Tax=Streptomyces sp. GQFP TaxID=2907545 RepID=UPI001F1819CB|nr:hypothetical protein [Streptomyces sp. GQFP]UIX33560.1 hypothetical protein LUX31_28125 [Streptomyces sp. GQFP]